MATPHRPSLLQIDPRRVRLNRGRHRWPLSPGSRSAGAADDARDEAGVLVAVVQPDLTLRGRVVRLLQEAGFRILASHDLREAAALVRARQPDVVILGAELQRDPAQRRLVERLRHDPTTSRIPLVVAQRQTATGSSELVATIRALIGTRTRASTD